MIGLTFLGFQVVEQGVSAQGGGACPLRGVSTRVNYRSCGRISLVRDPDGFTGIHEGEGTLPVLNSHGGCSAGQGDVLELERGMCMAFQAGVATPAGAHGLSVPFAILVAAGYANLLPSVTLADSGNVVVHEEGGSLLLDAEGDYHRKGPPTVSGPTHHAHVIQEVPLRAAAAPATASKSVAEADAGAHSEPVALVDKPAAVDADAGL
jgi:hypothetical protein